MKNKNYLCIEFMGIIAFREMKNILNTFLDLIEVKHTESFTDQYFNEHPHKYNLFGLSKILFDYGVENEAIRIPDKEKNIFNIITPFIAQYGGDFVAVHKIDNEQVSFIWKGIDHVLSAAKFVEGWTGIVLFAKVSEKSGEPDYKEHKKTETLNFLKRFAFISSLCLIALFAYIYKSYYTNLGVSLLLSVNLAGMYIGWLLLLKQMRIQSQYADKICSLFKQKDCNNILESPAAKLFGIIGWSEIGFGYFSANVLLLLFFPASLAAIALLNILTLPFTLWSVWYQGFKAKQWCALCLIVLALLWAIFIVNLLFSPVIANIFPVIGSDKVIYFHLFIVIFSYFASILSINFLTPKLNSEKTIRSLKQSMNSMKADEDVFTALLKKQPFYETYNCDSIIHFGNPDSKLQLTILINPNCNPCAKMHKMIKELLKNTNYGISVQYVLSSFGENHNLTNKYLIAFYLAEKNHTPTLGSPNHLQREMRLLKVFNGWFEKGKALRDDYFKDMALDMENPEIEIEFEKHEAWKQKSQIKATPTVLVNGYKLPESYKVEDLRYFTDINT